MKKSLQLTNDNHCFVCGPENINGLQMEWKTTGRFTESDFYPTKTHQGWQGLVHGGILATILDEAMTRLAWENVGGAVTAEMTIRYYRPARIGAKLLVKGEIQESKGRLIPASAEIRNTDGLLVASATGKVIKPKEPLT